MRRIIKNIIFCIFAAALCCGVLHPYRGDGHDMPGQRDVFAPLINFRASLNNEPPANKFIFVQQRPWKHIEEPAPRSYVKRLLRREVTLGAVGDVTLSSNYVKPYAYSFDYYYDTYGAAYFFENVRGIFEMCDVSVVNLECALTDDLSTRIKQDYAYGGKKEYTEILKLGGIDIVNLANNHSFDYGQAGFDDTVEALEAAGIEYFGYDNVLIYEINGLKIGFIGVWGSADTSASRLQRFRDQFDYLDSRGADLKIISIHWGYNDELIQNAHQTYLGRFFIDNGADLVLGHHPHVLQGIEFYNGKYIVYSLGNFIFDGNAVRDIEHRTTIIFQITFVLEGGRIISSEINLIPALSSSERWQNNFQPVLAEGEMHDYILRIIGERSE
ncbi:MAG: CapA family protein [Oscillospiraceae bacterium]|nr:CapA family protein [Oscillospiraceae bacterium]